MVMMGNAIKSAPSATVQVHAGNRSTCQTTQSIDRPKAIHQPPHQVSRAGVALAPTALAYDAGETLSLAAAGLTGKEGACARR